MGKPDRRRVGCHAKTVRQWLHRFNTHGVDGLGDRPRSGRPRRLDQTERGQLVALVGQDPTGRLVRQLRVADRQTVTCTPPFRNSAHYQRLLSLVEQANPTGEVVVVTDNLSSHTSVATREWLAGHPRIQQVFIPKKACWLNLQQGRPR